MGWCGFFEEDEEDRVSKYAEEVANSQADIDAWIQRSLREKGQVWNDEVSDRMENRNYNEGLPNPKPGREERENYSLDEKGDDTIDGHDDPDGLDCKAKAAGYVERRLRATAGGATFVLQENREKVVVRHAVVGEDAERDDYHGYFSSEDFGLVFQGGGCWTRSTIGIQYPFL